MLFLAHLIILKAFVLLIIAYSFEDSYNKAENHYRSVSGIIVIFRAKFVAIAVVMAFYLIYDTFASRFRDINLRYCNLLNFFIACALVTYDVFAYRYEHFVLLGLLGFFQIFQSVFYAMQFKELRPHASVFVLYTLIFFLVAIVHQPWTNVQIAFELVWCIFLYYMACVATYYTDKIQPYGGVPYQIEVDSG